MKKTLILFGFSFSLLACSAQTLRSWQKGPLTWNDFKTVVRDSAGEEHGSKRWRHEGEEHSYLEFSLDVVMAEEERDGVSVWMESAVARIDRKKSWVDSAWRTPNELHYNQVIFDLVELYRRYMQSEIDTGGTPDVGEYMELLVADVDQFCHDSRYGADSATVERWDEFVHDLMAEAAADVAASHADVMREVVPFSNYRTTQSFAMGLGGGMQIVTGDLHHYFRNGGGVLFEYEMGYGRSLLDFGLYLGGSRCLDTLWHKRNADQDLWRNDPLTVIDLKADYGFAAVESYRFRLAPFVGAGILGYYYTPDTPDASSIGPTAFNLRTGLDFRYHFLSDLVVYRDYCELSQLTLFAKAYAEYTRIWECLGTPGGWTFNIIVGLAFHESTRVAR